MGDKSQGEINFEFLGKDKTTITPLALAIERAFTNWVLIGKYVGCDAPQFQLLPPPPPPPAKAPHPLTGLTFAVSDV